MATLVDEPVPKQGVFEKPTEFSPSPCQKAARRKESLLAAGFLAPQLVGLIVFMLGPLIFCIFPCTFIVLAVPIVVRMLEVFRS